jgi:S-adenosylmethionine hydrolase
MAPERIITIITDFGYRDPFVGMMKGVILGINPEVKIVDITHGVSPHDVMEAAIFIGESHRYFPAGTVHVAVVDPGVGSKRRPIVCEAGGHRFVGPDNGVFTEVFRSAGQALRVWHVTESKYFLNKAGATFHGRDVFAPVASWLLKGVEPEEFGDEVDDFVTLRLPQAETRGETVLGEVVYIDVFGNCITNVREPDLRPFFEKRRPVEVVIKDRRASLRNYYAEAGDGKPHCLINSSGRLEVFLYKNSAARALDIKVGDKVKVTGH